MSEQPESVVIPFARAQGKRRPRAVTTVLPVLAPPASLDPAPSDVGPLFEVPDPTVPASSTKPRRYRPKPQQPSTPERKRALEIAQDYAAKQPLCSKRRVADAIETALAANAWPEAEIVAAVERLVDSPYGVTENSLRYQLTKTPQPAREVDPVIHQAIDAALEHLGRLDSETMTETESVLAAAVRSVCVAVMHAAAQSGGAS